MHLYKFIKDFRYSILTFIIGIILILVGLVREEDYIVLKKAVTICVKCIRIDSKRIVFYLCKLFLLL